MISTNSARSRRARPQLEQVLSIKSTPHRMAEERRRLSSVSAPRADRTRRRHSPDPAYSPCQPVCRVSISDRGVISAIERVPQPTIASLSSLLRMSMTRSTPAWPKLDSPHM